MQLCLIVTALLPALRPQLQDRVHPSILIAPSWRGKRIGGVTPQGVAWERLGLLDKFIPFPAVCSR